MKLNYLFNSASRVILQPVTKANPLLFVAQSQNGLGKISFNEKKYFLAVDYFSKFAELCFLSSTVAESIIAALKSIFQSHGIPDKVFSDNGPPFNSAAFKEFANTYNFSHFTSSPSYAQSNGLVERAIQTIKLRLNRDNSDVALMILDYNTTPKANLPSAAQMLMGRCLCSFLPIHWQQLTPAFHIKSFCKILMANQRHIEHL